MTTLIKINPPTPTVPLIESITIRIPIDEVFALQAVLCNIGGDIHFTRRTLTDNVLRVLQKATQAEKGPNHSDLKGTLRFSRREDE